MITVTMPKKAKRSINRDRILATLAFAGRLGMTCDEIEQDTKIIHQSASCVLYRLAVDGLIATNGRQRITRYGRAANVWIMTATGRDKFRRDNVLSSLVARAA